MSIFLTTRLNSKRWICIYIIIIDNLICCRCFKENVEIVTEKKKLKNQLLRNIISKLSEEGNNHKIPCLLIVSFFDCLQATNIALSKKKQETFWGTKINTETMMKSIFWVEFSKDISLRNCFNCCHGSNIVLLLAWQKMFRMRSYNQLIPF